MAVILTLFAFITWLFNVITDGFMVHLYWNSVPRNIAMQATACFSVTVVVSLGAAIWAIPKIAKGEDFPEGILSIWKNAEAVFQSIPQLLINLYALSPCDANSSRPITQLTSACASMIGVLWGIWGCYCFCITVGLRAEGREVKALDWFADAILFCTKVASICSRIFVIVYFSFYLTYWTSLFLVIHSTALLSYGLLYISYQKALSLFTTSHIMEYVGWISLLVWLQFTWFFDEFKKWSTLGFSIFYLMENMLLLAIASYHSFEGGPYCLYENVFIIQVVLNLCSVALAFMYCMKIRFSEDPSRPALGISDYQDPAIQVSGHYDEEPAD